MDYSSLYTRKTAQQKLELNFIAIKEECKSHTSEFDVGSDDTRIKCKVDPLAIHSDETKQEIQEFSGITIKQEYHSDTPLEEIDETDIIKREMTIIEESLMTSNTNSEGDTGITEISEPQVFLCEHSCETSSGQAFADTVYPTVLETNEFQHKYPSSTSVSLRICGKPDFGVQMLKNPFVHTEQCSYNVEVFDESSRLMEPAHIHSKKRSYPCPVCNKTFNQRWSLQTHKLLHTGERPYFCDICKKSFIQHSNYKAHLRIHTGERPYSCDVCKNSFSHFGNWKRHVRNHSSDRPFFCEVCHRSFKTIEDLKHHERVHTEERPYSCKFCNKAFRKSGQLKKHVLNHTGK